MKKYGLQLRIPPQQQQRKPAATRPTLPPSALGFGDDDDDEDDVERDIARQAAKNRALREVEEKHKKALEEDPSVFDYDGVYDEMKEKIARPVVQDRTERKSKYIEKLMEKAKQRQMEQEIIYEKKLMKERSKEDHLYQDKERFVTGAYKKKLEEQNKWMKEEHLRQLREEREDVTKKNVTDFYFNLDKNVAFGAHGAGTRNAASQEKAIDGALEKDIGDYPEKEIIRKTKVPVHAVSGEDIPDDGQTDAHIEKRMEPPNAVTRPVSPVFMEGTAVTEQKSEEQQVEKSYKRSGDAVAAARERYLARKKAKGQ